jgi:CheY-like chemotaxis protein
MMKRGSSESIDAEGSALAEPLEALQRELARLRSPEGTAGVSRDAIVSKLLEALRQVGEALQPLTRRDETPSPPTAGPVLAFRRGSREAEGSEPKGPVVLVIEPEPSVRDYIRSVLGQGGFDAISFATAREAIERARAIPPAAVTIDQLVLRHGDENWLVQFKTDPALARIPLVLVRAPDSEEAVHPFGIAAEVTKPIVESELVAALRAVCRTGDPAEPLPETEETPPPHPRVVRG